jgi:hypothetical protein
MDAPASICEQQAETFECSIGYLFHTISGRSYGRL